MTTFQIAGYLTEFAGGRAEIKLEGTPQNVGEALAQLWGEHGGLRDRVLTEQGQVRPHVNVFVNSQVVRRDQVLQIPISGDAKSLMIIPVNECEQAVSAQIPPPDRRLNDKKRLCQLKSCCF